MTPVLQTVFPYLKFLVDGNYLHSSLKLGDFFILFYTMLLFYFPLSDLLFSKLSSEHKRRNLLENPVNQLGKRRKRKVNKAELVSLRFFFSTFQVLLKSKSREMKIIQSHERERIFVSVDT